MLIPCFECGKEISDKAPACPQCGVPIPIEKGDNFKIFFGRLFGRIQAVCRKCRSPTKHNQYYCKTCGIYFPFHEFNKAFIMFYLTIFVAWFSLVLMSRMFSFFLS